LRSFGRFTRFIRFIEFIGFIEFVEFHQFRELLERSLFPERDSILRTTALQHRITAALKLGQKGQVYFSKKIKRLEDISQKIRKLPKSGRKPIFITG